MKYGFLLALPLSFLLACSSEIGECHNLPAARQLVYGPGSSVATKGQALMHQSCGQAAFCHSSAAEGTKRRGVPHGMDFDMLPSPQGLASVLVHAQSIWEQVESGSMPPRNYDVGDAVWTYSLARREDEPRLPKLSTREGKAVLRNWLACGAPVVTDSKVPKWAQLPGTLEPIWTDIHSELILKNCVDGPCHNKAVAAGHLALTDLCEAREALLKGGDCGEKRVRVVPGDVDTSFLIDKVSNDTPSCGDRMPTGGVLPEFQIEALRKWIENGAEAPDCP